MQCEWGASRESAGGLRSAELAHRSVDPKLGGLAIPVKLIRGGEEIVECDGAWKHSGECMSEDIRAELGDGEQFDNARSRNPVLLGKLRNLQTGFDEFIMPSIGQPDCVNEVLSWLGRGGDDQVMSIGAEKQPATIELLDLELQFQLDMLAAVIDLWRSQADRTRWDVLRR